MGKHYTYPPCQMTPRCTKGPKECPKCVIKTCSKLTNKQRKKGCKLLKGIISY